MGDFVQVAATGNQPDRVRFGCVPYEYAIAKYQLTNAEWCAFLNGVGAEKALALKLYHKDMSTGVLGGIVHLHLVSPPSFSPKPGWQKKPVVYLRYVDVCRYCNWLQTGDTEKGAYDLADKVPRRLPGARFFIPTVDEWYKAAYYDPATHTYRQYPTGNDLPRLDQANYERGDEFSKGPPFYLSDVDEYAASPSPWGCVQMGGNAWELLEDVRVRKDGSRVNLYKGGSFGYTETGLSKFNTDEAPYNGRCYVFGVRIASCENGWRPRSKPLKYDIMCAMSSMRDIAKRIAKSIWQRVPIRCQNRVYWWVEYENWRRDLRQARPFGRPDDRCGRRVAIVPCEPWSVIGSRGDEAMITAIMERERLRDPQTQFVFVTGGDAADAHRRFPTASFVVGWKGRFPLRSVNAVLRKLAPDAVYCLGADCMDGKYSPRTSLILLGAAAYASAGGAEAHLTGFSFNEHPASCLRRAFRTVAKFKNPRDPQVPLLTFNLRDAVSAQRFERFTDIRPQVVADIAFLMSPQPSPATEKWDRWCKAERSAGRFVLGLNLNPMLFPPAMRVEQVARVASILSACSAGLRGSDLSVLLIPHDYRNDSDLTCLKLLYEHLHGDPHVALVEDILSAPELKSLVGSLDALFTCRMHLGIAALGMGKPIAGFAYQGKFAGLMHHFNLPLELILDVKELDSLGAALQRLIIDCSVLTKEVARHLPQVQHHAVLSLKFEV